MSSPLPPVPGPLSTDKQGRLTPPWQAWFLQLYQYLSAPQSGGGGIVPINRAVNTTLPLTGGGTLGADLTLGVNAFSASNSGVVTASGGDPTYFLSADTTWKVPPSTLIVGTTTVSGATDTYILYNNAGFLGNYALTGTGTTAVMQGGPTLTGTVTLNAGASGSTLITYGVAAAFAGNFQAANSATGYGLLVQGNFTGAGPSNLLSVQDPNNTLGVNLQLVGNGATTPNKTIRVQSGSFQILNSGYSASLLTITDGGNATFGNPSSGDTLNLGQFAGSSQLALNGSTSGTVNIKTAAAAGTWSLQLPAAVPASNNSVLVSTTAGVSSWLASTGSAGSNVLSTAPTLTGQITVNTSAIGAKTLLLNGAATGSANIAMAQNSGTGSIYWITASTGNTFEIGANGGSEPATGAISVNQNKAVTVNAASSGSSLTIAAGTATVQPLQFTSGTNLTTAATGTVEYDGSVGYFTSIASNRAVWMAENVAVSTTTYQLANQTTPQKMLNTSTLGALTLAVGTYEFECGFALSALDTATSSVFGWTLAGAATKTVAWMSRATSGTIATAQTTYSTYNTAANAAIVPANTTGVGTAYITGIIRVTVAGTVVPQISTNTGATAALVAVNSYFKVRQVSGGTGIIAVGNWT